MLIGDMGNDAMEPVGLASSLTSLLSGASGQTCLRQVVVATFAGVTMSLDAAAIDIGDPEARSEKLRPSWRYGANGVVTVRQ